MYGITSLISWSEYQVGLLICAVLQYDIQEKSIRTPLGTRVFLCLYQSIDDEQYVCDYYPNDGCKVQRRSYDDQFPP